MSCRCEYCRCQLTSVNQKPFVELYVCCTRRVFIWVFAVLYTQNAYSVFWNFFFVLVRIRVSHSLIRIGNVLYRVVFVHTYKMLLLLIFFFFLLLLSAFSFQMQDQISLKIVLSLSESFIVRFRMSIVSLCRKLSALVVSHNWHSARILARNNKNIHIKLNFRFATRTMNT